MSTYQPFDFPAGVMLDVLRESAGTPGRFGSLESAGPSVSHQIGPCVFLPSNSDSDNEHAEGTPIMRSGVIQMPVGQDIKADDFVRTPDGLVARVTGKPHTPTNPWTGWQPFTRITVEQTRFQGA